MAWRSVGCGEDVCVCVRLCVPRFFFLLHDFVYNIGSRRGERFGLLLRHSSVRIQEDVVFVRMYRMYGAPHANFFFLEVA